MPPKAEGFYPIGERILPSEEDDIENAFERLERPGPTPEALNEKKAALDDLRLATSVEDAANLAELRRKLGGDRSVVESRAGKKHKRVEMTPVRPEDEARDFLSANRPRNESMEAVLERKRESVIKMLGEEGARRFEEGVKQLLSNEMDRVYARLGLEKVSKKYEKDPEMQATIGAIQAKISEMEKENPYVTVTDILSLLEKDKDVGTHVSFLRDQLREMNQPVLSKPRQNPRSVTRQGGSGLSMAA